MGFVESKKFLETNERLKVILIYSDQNGNQKTFISEDLQDSVEEF
jgi:thiamine biosynthesis lipoprotein